jgi:nucleoside-diphosphate-sugar epimerase
MQGKILVLGATGATGSLLVEQLLSRGYSVKAVVRSTQKLSALTASGNLELVEAAILDLSDAELSNLVNDCTSVISCLGHNLTWKGIYGKPRRLVTDAVRRVTNAVKSNDPDTPVRYILMNTTGNRNRDLKEPVSAGQRLVISLLRVLLPPHVDNEKAADYLRTKIGQDDKDIEWVAVRPDGLIDEDEVSDYIIHPSPTRSPIFNAGKTSRINVASFMAELVSDNHLWLKWKGQMPVIYNKGFD